ncbi:MAG: Nif3-like dinuclear metal center hexameric protein [Bacteroidota bacterium]|nr:Nif3-like dinuclear metal center hexameric protein [Bacteroidota bacterium]
MTIGDITQTLEKAAPTVYQEEYDNCGLITGMASWACTGILCTLDATEEVILEAKRKNCNLVVAHHPIVFRGLKRINGYSYVERAIIAAIKNDIAIYAIHTNLDNVQHGVNHIIASKLGLKNCTILDPKENLLMKLFTFVPLAHAAGVQDALFAAGAGNIGEYSECSFSAEGKGTFKGSEGANPFVGEKGIRHEEKEVKLEVIFPAYMQKKVVQALLKAHPYEEVAYDLVALSNSFERVGSGMIGELPEAKEEKAFLSVIQSAFGLQAIKHTALTGKKVKKVAVCGGAGSFLLGKAIAAGADFFISSDIKYHEFFDADGQLVIADIGHWESEQFTPDLLVDILQSKFPTFAVLKSEVSTNPVAYFLGE